MEPEEQFPYTLVNNKGQVVRRAFGSICESITFGPGQAGVVCALGDENGLTLFKFKQTASLGIADTIVVNVNMGVEHD